MNIKKSKVSKNLIAVMLIFVFALSIMPMTVFADTDTEISIISIENATLSYDAGDKPKATAEKFEIEGVISNYEIEYECWEEMETTESGESVPIKFWYSDESQYTSSQQKITTFEVGKTYMYSISVKAEDGYSFADDYELYVNSVAQQSVIKTQNRLLITAITTIQPRSTQLQNISVVEINNATISFNVGDKPVFTGKTPDNAPYIYQCEWWETDEGKEGKHSTDFFDGGFERLITNFERGKTYNYGIYLKAAEGYCFTTDTKLKINGKYYDYDTNDYDPLLQYDNDGFATMWVHTDLTMTPISSEPFKDTIKEIKSTDAINARIVFEKEVNKNYKLDIKQIEIIKNLSDKNVKYLVDINILENGEVVKINGTKMKIKIALPEELKGYKKYEVVYILNDEIKETIPATIEDGYIVFETTHLSEYGIVATNSSAIESPKTYDGITTWIILGLISMSGIVGTSIYRKKKIYN